MCDPYDTVLVESDVVVPLSPVAYGLPDGIGTRDTETVGLQSFLEDL